MTEEEQEQYVCSIADSLYTIAEEMTAKRIQNPYGLTLNELQYVISAIKLKVNMTIDNEYTDNCLIARASLEKLTGDPKWLDEKQRADYEKWKYRDI